MESNYECKRFRNLLNYIKHNECIGYDPYDALNSRFLGKIPSKFIKLGSTQMFVYSPINLRLVFGIKRNYNSKGLGLVLQAICNAFKIGIIKKNEFNKLFSNIADKLIELSSKGYSGYCWGFNFPWQDITRFSRSYLPTIVNTSFIGNAFLDLYEITRNEKYLKIVKSAKNFILNDLNLFENDKGICFSYTPIDHNVVHNASLLGASLLARLSLITDNHEDMEIIKKVLNFSLSYQRENGLWPYSLDKKTGNERMQIDFHQGFILDSLMDIVKYTGLNNRKLEIALKKGLLFYHNEQFEGGRSRWRWPRRWPVDIHHQAQGILTFCKAYEYFKEKKYLDKAEKIMDYTLENMYDERGFFYYQKWPFFTNKISYMRWSQAWMLLALSKFLTVKKN